MLFCGGELCVCVQEFRDLHRPDKSVRSLETVVTNGRELIDVGAGN